MNKERVGGSGLCFLHQLLLFLCVLLGICSLCRLIIIQQILTTIKERTELIKSCCSCFLWFGSRDMILCFLWFLSWNSNCRVNVLKCKILLYYFAFYYDYDFIITYVNTCVINHMPQCYFHKQSQKVSRATGKIWWMALGM